MQAKGVRNLMAVSVGMKMKTEVKGPLFEGKAGRMFRQHMEAAVREMAQNGEGWLDEKLRPRPAGYYKAIPPRLGGSTGSYRRNIQSTTRGLNALISDGGVIYGPWLEGISSRNSPSRFPGYAAFRNATQYLQSIAKKVTQEHVFRFVRRMNK